MTLLLALSLLACEQAPLPGAALVEDAVTEVGFVPPPAPQESAALSTPPLREGNRARLLTNGEASLQARLELIAQAQRTIYLQALIFKADTSGRALAQALIARKKAMPSLDIRVIVDAYANIQDVQAQLLFFELQNAGIDVEGFEAFYLHWLNEVNLSDWLAGNKRFHEKYLVVDGSRAIVGGMNIADEYFRCSDDPALTWRDQDLLVEGPVARDVAGAFLDNHAWFKAVKDSKPELLNPDVYWRQWQRRHPAVDAVMDTALAAQRRATATVTGRDLDRACAGTPVPATAYDGVPMRFLRSRPREGEDHIHSLYLEQIAAAQHSVILENAYFVPDPELQQALVAAASRGVDVRVITNSDKTNDIPMITIAGRARYLALIEAGVQVYEWHAESKADPPEGTVHAKLGTFDDRVAIIGSYNLDPRSRGLNSEDVVLVEHAPLAAELADYIRDRDLPLATRIGREEALAWADPMALPAPPEQTLPWTDPRFDPRAFEYFLLRQIEGSL